MSDNNPLATLREDIEAHWREHRPRMVAELEAKGRLREAIERAARLTEEAVLEAVARGMPFPTAWETFREEWAFLPAETESLPGDEEDMWEEGEAGDDDAYWF